MIKRRIAAVSLDQLDYKDQLFRKLVGQNRKIEGKFKK
jgi:hypothetical protein